MTMAPAILDVRHLQTHFFTRQGVARAVDDISFSLQPGEILGLVGESGSGKSMTGFSLLGLVDAPGKIVGGQILFKGEDLRTMGAEDLRHLRGNRIAMIFQDPMMTLNPVLRIDTQMIETLQAHQEISRAAAYERARLPVQLVILPGAVHGGKVFYDAERTALMLEFLQKIAAK